MKTIIVALVASILLLSYIAFKEEVEYYPQGYMGRAVPYYSAGAQPLKCHRCGGKAYLFKRDQRKRILCDECYRKL